MTREEFEKQRQDFLRKSAKGGKDMWWSPDPGTYIIRLGPPWSEKGDFFKERIMHGSFVDKVQLECAENDIDKTTGHIRKCGVCAAWRQLKGHKGAYEKALGKLIFPKTKVLWNVLVAKKVIRNPKHPTEAQVIEIEKRFRVWELSGKWQGFLMTEFSGDGSGDFWKYTDKAGNERDNPLAITHPVYGRWLRAKRTNTGNDTNWAFDVVTGQCPITADRDELKAIGDTLNDLDSLVKGATDEELAGFLSFARKKAKKETGGGSVVDDDDMFGAAPNKAKAVSSAKDLFDELGGDSDDDIPF